MRTRALSPLPLLALLVAALVLSGCHRSRQEEEITAADAADSPLAASASPTDQRQTQITPTPRPLLGGLAALRRKATPTTGPTATITPTMTPTRLIEPTPGPTVAPDLALEFTTVKPDQFLSTIASRYGVSVDDIVKFSGIENPNFVAIGQGLIIPHRTTRYTPDRRLIPDSEFVYGLGYVDFDTAEFVESQGGYLAGYSMRTPSGDTWTGADLIERFAMRYSLGPRLLLALLEARSGWVTNPEPEQQAIDRPFGHLGGATGLYPQLEWAAGNLNRGFYGWLDRGETAIRFHNNVIARGAPGLNPATFGVQRMLARDVNPGDLQKELDAFEDAYRRLFGDPWELDAGAVLPAGLTQPQLQLPWKQGERWYLTGGPHGGWGSGSSWAALDFVPDDIIPGTCETPDSWAVAAAPGVVARNDNGELLIDLDMDGDIRTGWVLQYLHLVDRPKEGTMLKAGDPVGRPGCAGGLAQSSHLHMSRRFNGLWVAAAGPVPFTLGGWRAEGDFEYFGRLVGEDGTIREACDCKNRAINEIPW